jgi:hypothetical protein
MKKILNVVSGRSIMTGSVIYKIVKEGKEVARGNNLKRLMSIYGQI